MRLLVVNYEMDDGSPVLAWQAGVVRELARRADRVAVLTERAGPCALPGNVTPARLVVLRWLLCIICAQRNRAVPYQRDQRLLATEEAVPGSQPDPAR